MDDKDSYVDFPMREGEPLTPWQVLKSILSAAFRVQTRENRERDFNHGNPIVFIIAGLIFTAMFVMAILSVVYLVL